MELGVSLSKELKKSQFSRDAMSIEMVLEAIEDLVQSYDCLWFGHDEGSGFAHGEVAVDVYVGNDE